MLQLKKVWNERLLKICQVALTRQQNSHPTKIKCIEYCMEIQNVNQPIEVIKRWSTNRNKQPNNKQCLNSLFEETSVHWRIENKMRTVQRKATKKKKKTNVNQFLKPIKIQQTHLTIVSKQKTKIKVSRSSFNFFYYL